MSTTQKETHNKKKNNEATKQQSNTQNRNNEHANMTPHIAHRKHDIETHGHMRAKANGTTNQQVQAQAADVKKLMCTLCVLHAVYMLCALLCSLVYKVCAA